MSNIVIQGFPNSGSYTREQLIGYKSFVAVLTQNSNNDPVAIVMENSLGVQATWSYSNTGEYYVTFDQPIFNSPQEYVTMSGTSIDIGSSNDPIIMTAVPVFFNVLWIQSFLGGSLSNDVMGAYCPCILEIRKYL